MLTDAQIRKLKKTAVVKVYTDANGLFLEVRPTGKKVFRFRYIHPQTKKRQLLTIGEYPLIGLADARGLRDDAKKLLKQGIDPNQLKKESKLKALAEIKEIERLANRLTFTGLYTEYCEFKSKPKGAIKPTWQAYTLQKHNERFNNFVLPLLGNIAIEELTEIDLENCLLSVQEHGTLANLQKIKTVFNGMFDYAKAKRYITRNIAKYITNSLFLKHTATPFKHVTTTGELADIVKELKNIRASFEVKTCLNIALLVFTRPSEISGLKWADINQDTKLITIESTKTGKPLLIPISKQVSELLEQIQPLTGHTEYVFYSPYGTGKPISRDSLSNALKRNGITNINPHGFRHTASTALNNLGFDADIIELQLNHSIKGVRGIYNKAEKLNQRAKMMQSWADYLDGLKVGNNVIQFKQNSS